jgi:flagellar basal-body rod modification protein FlgD
MTSAISSATTDTALYSAINGAASSVQDSTSKSSVSTAKEQNDRFLTLLTTQLTNQDPLNPMDNSQMTSQMAQISTVSGLEQLNAAMTALATQFSQLQALQGASLVGREVTVEGTTLKVADGKASGAFELDAAAQAVTVEVLSPSGQIVRSVELGTRDAGTHNFEFADTDLSSGLQYKFRVVGQSGTTILDATEMVRDTVKAVGTSGKTLTLELANSGAVAYEDIHSIN